MKYVNTSIKSSDDLRKNRIIISIRRDWPWQLAAFFLGLVVCGEIFDLFTINNTYVEVPHIYAFALLTVCLVIDYKQVVLSFQKYCVFGLKLFTAMVFFLIVPGMLRFINSAWALTPLKGAIMYMALFAVFLDVVILRNYKDDILKGVLFGFGLNLLYTVIQFFLYQIGQNYVLLQGLTDKEIMYINGIFRAEGFFTEPSHYWLFLVTFFPLFLSRIRSSGLNFCLMSFVLIIFTYTISGGVYAIVICYILYYVFVSRMKEHVKLHSRKFYISSTLLIFAVLLFLVVALFRIFPYLNSMGIDEYVRKSFLDISLSDTSNSSTQQRFSSIIASMKLIPKYWMGSGYGMASPIIQESYHMKYYVASFSFPITCTLETGILGLIGYLSTIYTLGFRLIRKNKNARCRALAVGCLMCFLGQILTGRIIYPYMMLLFGLASLEYVDANEER